MELNLHTSKPSKNSQAYPNDATSDTDTELSFEQVSRFWRSMSTERKEETLMIKEPKIIENVLQALNDVNFLSQCQDKRRSVETGRRTVLYPRPNKPAIILSISEFDHSQSKEENTNEKSYHASVVVLMLLGYENTRQSQQTYPNIEEEELREYIYNIDLLEQHKALLKVKHAKLDGILGVFGELDSKFCQRKKKIIPEEQHWRLFQSHNRDQLSWGKALRAQSKISRYLKSVLKIFENDLISAYEENKHYNGDLDDRNNDFLEQQSAPQLEQNDFDQEQPYYHDYHRRSFRYPDLYQYDISNTFRFYPSHYSNYMGYIVPQQFSQNYYSRNFYGKQKLRLVPVAHGVYFGNLAFSLKDHHIEEQEYGTEEELPSQRIKPNPFIHKNKREYATDYYKPKRYYQTYNIKGQYNNDNKPNDQNSNQSDNLITPLQILLATPLQDQRLQNEYHAQENRTSDSKCSIPLLESIIQIPGSKILHTTKQSDSQGSQVLSFDEQKGLLVVKADENKSKTNENSSKSSPNKLLEDDTIKFFEEHLSSAKQDELELSTTTSMESTSKNGDKETQGEFYQKPRLKPSEGSNKKKLKNSNGNKSRGNTRNKDWDRNMNGAKNPDNQSKRQTEFSHNLKDYSFDAFPTLEGTNNPRSKDKI